MIQWIGNICKVFNWPLCSCLITHVNDRNYQTVIRVGKVWQRARIEPHIMTLSTTCALVWVEWKKKGGFLREKPGGAYVQLPIPTKEDECL